MSRPINESIEILNTSLDNIKTSLESKLPSGGGIDSLKVSEVSSYIDQIETGGGGGSEVKLPIEITSVKCNGKPVENKGRSSAYFSSPISIEVNFNLTGEPIYGSSRIYICDYDFKYIGSQRIFESDTTYTFETKQGDYAENLSCYILVFYNEEIVQVFNLEIINENYEG